MVNFRTFLISGETFSHFKTQVDLDEVNNISQIIEIVRNNLNQILTENNLTSLSEKLLQIKYHVHDYTFEDVLISDNKIIFYICDHDH